MPDFPTIAVLEGVVKALIISSYYSTQANENVIDNVIENVIHQRLNPMGLPGLRPFSVWSNFCGEMGWTALAAIVCTKSNI